MQVRRWIPVQRGETVRENLVEVSPGVKVWTAISGEENQVAVMLCGGGPGCADYLEPLAEMLDDSTKVIRFEQRGCGRSTEDYRCDVDTTVADVDAIRRYYNISSWIIAGHSWGANLALAYASKHPERSLALMYISGNGAQNDRLWSEEYHKNQAEFGERLAEFPYASNMEVNRLGNLSWRKFIQSPSLWADLSRLHLPALFLYGSKDIRPSWPAEQLARLLPNATWTSVEGAPHYMWLTHADETRDALREFIAGVLGQQPLVGDGPNAPVDSSTAHQTTPDTSERTGLLHHVEINVSDLERSSAFWGWLLGYLGYEPYQSWVQGRSWRRDEMYLVLVQTEQGFVEAGYHRKRTGLNHVAFHARSRHQVDELTTLLRDKGVLILYEDRHPHAGGPDHYAVFFEDPNRIKVEVVAP